MSELMNTTWKGYIENDGIEPIANLEQICWSPWLAAPLESLAGRAEVFPDGQLCIKSELGLLATLSVNKIQWNGQPESLPTWDYVAGDPTTYENTFAQKGNTLCLMSMNVSEQGRGQQLPKLLIQSLLEYAASTNVSHVIGSFRPSAYSKAVLASLEQDKQPPTFEEYCATTNEDGYPVDPWLRSLTKNGMQPIAVDHKAMYVPVSEQEFEVVKQPFWKQIKLGGKDVWWCNETGFFYPQSDGSYVYAESNLWGSLNADKK
jgi:hypothetical protein